MDTLTIEKRLAELKAELASVQGTPTEVYSRIVGYYRSVKNWNVGKREEFAHRVTFHMPEEVPSALGTPSVQRAAEAPELFGAPDRVSGGRPYSYLLFTRETCPNCPSVREFLAETGLRGRECDVDLPEGLELARGFGVLASPTAVLLDEEGAELYRAFSVTELRAFLEPVAAFG